MSKPTKVTYTIQDNKGKLSYASVWLKYNYPDIPATSSLDNLISASQYIASLIDPLISGQIVNISVTRQVELPIGLSGAPSTVSDVEEKGVFVFGTSNSRTLIILPTILDTLIVSGTDNINQSDVNVTQLIFDFTDGSGSPLENIHPSDNRDNAFSQFYDAYELFKASK